MQVLYAGENVHVLLSLRSYLRDEHHDLKVVSNGLGCISNLRNEAPDVLVMEQRLLWGGSEGVLTLMREEPSIPPIPVLLLPESRTELRQGRRAQLSGVDYSSKQTSIVTRRFKASHFGEALGLATFLSGKGIDNTCVHPLSLTQSSNVGERRNAVGSIAQRNEC